MKLSSKMESLLFLILQTTLVMFIEFLLVSLISNFSSKVFFLSILLSQIRNSFFIFDFSIKTGRLLALHIITEQNMLRIIFKYNLFVLI